MCASVECIQHTCSIRTGGLMSGHACMCESMNLHGTVVPLFSCDSLLVDTLDVGPPCLLVKYSLTFMCVCVCCVCTCCRCGIWVASPPSAPTGAATTPTLTPSFSWWTRRTRSELTLHGPNCMLCWGYVPCRAPLTALASCVPRRCHTRPRMSRTAHRNAHSYSLIIFSLWLQESDLASAILLVFANKQDMKGALNAAQISEALGLASFKERQWSIQETSATGGKGLHEGFDWLVGAIKATGK